MWGLPRPGIKLVSLALQGRFLITGPPGKPSNTTCSEDCPFPVEVLASLSKIIYNHLTMETSLVIQWLRLHASTLGDRGSIPGQETKIPHAVRCSQQLKEKKFFKSLDHMGLFLGSLLQGSPIPGPQTSTVLKSVRNGTTQREVSGRQVNKASSATPHSSHHRLNHIPLIPWKKCFSWNSSLVSKMLHWGACIFLNYSFLQLYAWEWDCWAIW